MFSARYAGFLGSVITSRYSHCSRFRVSFDFARSTDSYDKLLDFDFISYKPWFIRTLFVSYQGFFKIKCWSYGLISFGFINYCLEVMLTVGMCRWIIFAYLERRFSILRWIWRRTRRRWWRQTRLLFRWGAWGSGIRTNI